jgi:exodeoxyribonuclease-5
MSFKRKGLELIDRPQNGLVIVDEASMVGRNLWEELWDVCLLLDLKILLVGDTFQLAPVEARDGEGPFQILRDIDTPFRAGLTEVTRQAMDSPILRASMLLREQSMPHAALALLPRVFSRDFDDKCMEIYQAGGVIIVHKNETRHRINAMIRERLYGPFNDEIRPGEPLLVLRNTYEIERFNGEIVKYEGWDHAPVRQGVVRDPFKSVSLPLSFGVAKVDGQRVLLCPEQVRGQASIMSESTIAKFSRREYRDEFETLDEDPFAGPDEETPVPPHLHANFGYCLTAHKSQGSQWDTVLVYLERSTRYNSYEGRRWAYTALTRACKTAYFSIEP